MRDLTPAALHLGALVAGVRDDQLEAPTPCPDWSVGALLDHIGGLAVAFNWAAEKAEPPGGSQPPSGNAGQLPDDFREVFPARLRAMAEAFQDPSAWEGLSTVGGVKSPADQTAMFGFDELVLHAWDLARATNQPFTLDGFEDLRDFLEGFVRPEGVPGLFGPVVAVDGSLADRVAGLTGRQPAAWPAA